MQPEMAIVYGDVQDEVWMEGRLTGHMYMETESGLWKFDTATNGRTLASSMDRDTLLWWLMGE